MEQQQENKFLDFADFLQKVRYPNFGKKARAEFAAKYHLTLAEIDQCICREKRRRFEVHKLI